jgi:hypothetical protein
MSRSDPNTFVHAAMLLNRICEENPDIIMTEVSFFLYFSLFFFKIIIKRLFLISALIANKFLEDEILTNSYWVIIADNVYTLSEINVMELEFLELLDYNIYYDENIYNQFCVNVHSSYVSWIESRPKSIKKHPLDNSCIPILSSPSSLNNPDSLKVPEEPPKNNFLPSGNSVALNKVEETSQKCLCAEKILSLHISLECEQNGLDPISSPLTLVDENEMVSEVNHHYL